MMDDSIFLKALNKEKLSTPPIWYMRQAGRYMPEYRAVRKNFKNFLDMCKNPEVCCELALQPMNAYNLDSAILFSDILTIPDAMGLGVKFLEGEGPVFDNPIRSPQNVIDIPLFNPDSLSYVYKAVSNIRNALPANKPLIGFSGSPWTLAAYSIEGRSSKDFKFTKNFIMSNNAETHLLLTKLTDAIAEPRADVKEYAPKMVGVRIPNEFIGALIGPGGKVIQELQKETGTTIVINEDPVTEEGIVEILGTGQEGIDAVLAKIDSITFKPFLIEENQ